MLLLLLFVMIWPTPEMRVQITPPSPYLSRTQKQQNPRCGEPGCLKRPRYGEEGGRARFCAAHRFDDMVDLASRRSTAGGGGAKAGSGSPAKRPRNGPRSFAHDSAAAAAAAAAKPPALPAGAMPAFSLGAGGGVGGGGGGGGRAPLPKRGHPVPKRGHTPARAGGHRVSFVLATLLCLL